MGGVRDPQRAGGGRVVLVTLYILCRGCTVNVCVWIKLSCLILFAVSKVFSRCVYCQVTDVIYVTQHHTAQMYLRSSNL